MSTKKENLPLIPVPDDVYIGEGTIFHLVERMMTLDPIQAYGIAKMMQKDAKEVTDRNKDRVLSEIEAAGGGTVKVGDANFTYKNGTTKYEYNTLAKWVTANELVQQARVNASVKLDELKEDEDYQLLLFKLHQAEQKLEQVEKQLRDSNQAVEVKGTATVAVSFPKS